MLDLTKMSAGDAKHSLEVLAWLNVNRDELQSIAAKNDTALSMAGIVAAGGFNDEDNFLTVTSTRFFPVEVQFFTDQVALEGNPNANACLTLRFVEDSENAIQVSAEDNSADTLTLSRMCGIDPNEKTWTLDDF